MRKAIRLAALVVATVFPGVAAAADAPWRIDLEGGALAVPSDVRPRLRSAPFVPGPGEVARTDFDAGGSYALGAGYALTSHIELTGQFQHSLPGYH